jgi:hypothetical protein
MSALDLTDMRVLARKAIALVMFCNSLMNAREAIEIFYGKPSSIHGSPLRKELISRLSIRGAIAGQGSLPELDFIRVRDIRTMLRFVEMCGGSRECAWHVIQILEGIPETHREELGAILQDGMQLMLEHQFVDEIQDRLEPL